jgi:hypothetical protein
MRGRSHLTPSPKPRFKLKLDHVQRGAQACAWDGDDLGELARLGIAENYIDPGIADARSARTPTRTRDDNVKKTLDEMISMYKGAREVVLDGGVSVVVAFNANQEVAGLCPYMETTDGGYPRLKDICSNPATSAARTRWARRSCSPR